MELDFLVITRYFLCNIVTNMVMFLFLSKMYKSTYERKWIYLLSCAISVLLRTGVACLGIPPINVLTGLICINIASVLLYRCKLKECLLYNSSFILVSLFADIIGTSLISVIVGNTIDEVFASHFYKYIGSLFNCILQILFSRWLLYFFKKENRSPIQTKETAFLTVTTVLEILIIMYATNNILNEISGMYLILLSCGFLFINMYVVHLIEQAMRTGKLQRDLSLAKQQSQLQLSHYQKLKEKQEVSRKVVHDVKKHLCAIEGLYSSGCKDEATNYGVLLKKELSKLGGEFTHENKILEAIIGSKIEQANIFNINFIVDIQNFNISFMDDLDITVVFANLLDNSFEACMELATDIRTIELHIFRHKNFIVINISNPIAFAVKKEGLLFKSTKKGHGGIGLSNVYSVVKKYDGSFIASVENDKFVVKILIPAN